MLATRGIYNLQFILPLVKCIFPKFLCKDQERWCLEIENNDDDEDGEDVGDNGEKISKDQRGCQRWFLEIENRG